MQVILHYELKKGCLFSTQMQRQHFEIRLFDQAKNPNVNALHHYLQRKNVHSFLNPLIHLDSVNRHQKHLAPNLNAHLQASPNQSKSV